VKRALKCIPVGAFAASLLILSSAARTNAQPAEGYRDRLPADEIIYFLLPDRFENGDASNDRGGLEGGRLVTGFDPTAKGFYHGGDLRGLMRRLDYVQSLGATAIWLAPVFKNKPVQGSPGHESAGYHGYWITDFTRVDPHFGSNEDMRALVGAAHARGMKVYLDIVVNHTADVIAYRECPRACPYRSRADFPYQRRGGIGGEPINAGFLGDAAENQTQENFARLTRPDYAYTPYIARGDEHVKVPDWLNDPIYYHNRGESTFSGESSSISTVLGSMSSASMGFASIRRVTSILSSCKPSSRRCSSVLQPRGSRTSTSSVKCGFLPWNQACWRCTLETTSCPRCSTSPSRSRCAAPLWV
jgi:hypothetical protein